MLIALCLNKVNTILLIHKATVQNIYNVYYFKTSSMCIFDAVKKQSSIGFIYKISFVNRYQSSCSFLSLKRISSHYVQWRSDTEFCGRMKWHKYCQIRNGLNLARWPRPAISILLLFQMLYLHSCQNCHFYFIFLFFFFGIFDTTHNVSGVRS